MLLPALPRLQRDDMAAGKVGKAEMTKEQREAYHKGVLEMAKMRRAMKRKEKHPPDTVSVPIALAKLNYVREGRGAELISQAKPS